MLPLRIVSRPDVERAVARLGLAPAPGKLEAELAQVRDRLWAKAVAGIREADRPWHRRLRAVQRLFDLRQFVWQRRGDSGLREVRMRPAMVADLETKLMQLADFVPRHEVRRVVHPAMR